MKDTLDELRGSMSGILGAFVIDETGAVAAESMPDIMKGASSKVSRAIKHVIDVIKATKTLDRITVDGENGKFILMTADGRVLVVLTQKEINLALFKLMSNMAAVKIKEAKAVAAAKPKGALSRNEIEAVCSAYDEIFSTIARRLANVIGPKAASLFETGTTGTRRTHSGIYIDVKFDTAGKPDLKRIKENAASVSRAELLLGLEELASSMIEIVKANAGSTMADKARDEADKLREKYHGIIAP